jgi:hypothetical protein
MQTYHFRDLPAISFLFPDNYKLAGVRGGVWFLIIEEFMVANFHRPVSGNRIHLKAAINQGAGYLPADILFRTRQDVGFGSGESAFVMEKFDITGINI